jgi:hypothetical protein
MHEVRIVTPNSTAGYLGIKARYIYTFLFEDPFDYSEMLNPHFEDFCI